MYFEKFETGIQFNIDNVAIDKSDMLEFAKNMIVFRFILMRTMRKNNIR